MDSGSGGYEYDFAGVPPDRVLCKICHNPCRDAYLTGCCGTNFCYSCLQQLKKGTAINKACPICREEKFRIFPNKGLDREIKSFSVYCENRRGGCTWSGEINNVEKHIAVDCQFVEVTCPSKCGLKLKRQCVQQHLDKECPCRCQHCGATGKREEIAAKHKTHCLQHPRPCPNGCKLGVMPSGGMPAHRKLCPLELIQCEYYVVGCESLVARQDLEKHYNRKMADHLSLVKSKLASTNKSLAESNKKLVSIGKELGVTRKTLNDAKTRYSELAETAAETEAELRWLVDEEYLRTKNELMRLRAATALQCDQVMVTSAYFDAIFTRFNSLVLAVLILFMCVYIIQVKLTSERLYQSDQYTWPATLDHVSKSSMYSKKTVPFIYKINNKDLYQTSTWGVSSFYLFNEDYKILMNVEYSKKEDGVFVSLSFNKRKLEEIGEWPLKALFMIEVLNQYQNHDHHVVPLLINIDYSKVCHLSDDGMITCKTFVIYGEHLSDQYMNDNSVYLRISQIPYKEGIWNLYNWFGATIFNLLLSYIITILWTAIGAIGMMALFVNRGAWLSAKPSTYIVFLSMCVIVVLWSFTPLL